MKSFFVDALVFLMGWSVPGYFVLQALFLWRWEGKWRRAAAMPLAPMGLAILYVIYASGMRGSNIAPVVIVFTAPLAFLYLAVLWFLRKRGQSGA